MPNFEYVNNRLDGDPIIKPVKGYPTQISFVLIYPEGDAIFYLSRTGKSERFDITSINNSPLSESARYDLPCNKLISFTNDNINKLSSITGIKLEDLLEVREIERVNKSRKILQSHQF